MAQRVRMLERERGGQRQRLSGRGTESEKVRERHRDRENVAQRVRR